MLDVSTTRSMLILICCTNIFAFPHCRFRIFSALITDFCSLQSPSSCADVVIAGEAATTTTTDERCFLLDIDFSARLDRIGGSFTADTNSDFNCPNVTASNNCKQHDVVVHSPDILSECSPRQYLYRYGVSPSLHPLPAYRPSSSLLAS